MVELEHITYWAARFLDFDVRKAREKRLLQLNELEKFRLNTYENAQITRKE